MSSRFALFAFLFIASPSGAGTLARFSFEGTGSLAPTVTGSGFTITPLSEVGFSSAGAYSTDDHTKTSGRSREYGSDDSPNAEDPGNGAYLQFTLTPDPGQSVTIGEVTWWHEAYSSTTSSHSSSRSTLWWSLDNYAAPVSDTVAPSTTQLTTSTWTSGWWQAGSTFAPVTVSAPVTFRLCIWDGGTLSSKVHRFDDIVISSTKEDFAPLRAKWHATITGGQNLDPKDSLVASKLTSLVNNANSYWTSMDKGAGRTYLWPDAASTTVSAHITTCYARLRSMALAYGTHGSSLEGDPTLREDLLSALDWMHANRYFIRAYYDNWWDWQIGTPQKLNDILVLMYADLGATRLNQNLVAIDYFDPTANTMTGANRSDICLVVAVRGLLGQSAWKMAEARDGLTPVFAWVTSGDGFHADGSFLQHTTHAYTGSYGAELIKGVSYLYALLQGSRWEITDPSHQNLFEWIRLGYGPLFFKGAIPDMTRGRAISRQGSTDHSNGAYILGSILRVARAAPPAQAAPILSFIKAQALADTSRNFVSSSSLAQLAEARALMDDASVVPEAESTAHVRFPQMDRVVHRRPTYAYGLALSSSRISNYESINSENLRGWFTGDGLLYFQNADLTQFSDDFWPTVDPYHLPGTTVDLAARADGSGQSHEPAQDWVGGVDLDGQYGSAGMMLAGYGSTLTARKSWFFFDNEVVCLGAGVSSSGPTNIHTTVENRRLSTSGNEALTIDGAAQPTSLGWSIGPQPISWMHLAGTGGTVFPGPATVNLKREARTGDYYSINHGYSTTATTRNYLTCWIDHGAAPNGAGYAYTLLPEAEAAATAAYASAPDTLVLSNTAMIQAVREQTLGLTAVHFWDTAGGSAGGLTSSRQAAVMVRRQGSRLEVAVSDPTQKLTGNTRIILDQAAGLTLSADAGITVVQRTPQLILDVALAGKQGSSLQATFSDLAVVADRFPCLPGSSALADVLANDSTLAGGSLAVTAIGVPAHGTAAWEGGALRYTPDPGFTGTDTFSYTATDGTLSASAGVTVEVASGPLAAVPLGVGASTDDGNGPANTLDGSLATRWSALGDPQWIQYDLGERKIIDSLGIAFYLGNTRRETFDVSVSPDGSSWETLLDHVQSGGTTVDLESIDLPDRWARHVRITGHGNTSSAWNSLTEVTFQTRPDQAPASTVLVAHTVEGVATPFDPLAAAVDPDGGPGAPRILHLAAPAHGTAEIISGTLVRYTPEPGFTGSESFPCQVTDGMLAGTVTLTAVIDRFTTFAGFTDHYFTRQGITEPATTGPDGDPDHDGRTNWLEFALGSDPRTAEAGTGLVLTENSPSGWTVSVPVRLSADGQDAVFGPGPEPTAAAAGIIYRLQAATRPGTWGEVALTESPSSAPAGLPPAPAGCAYHHFVLSAGAPRAFVRLKADGGP